MSWIPMYGWRNGVTRSTRGDPIGDAHEMSLQQTGDEERDHDRRDDPCGAPRAGLAASEVVLHRLFRINLLVCSKHAAFSKVEPSWCCFCCCYLSPGNPTKRAVVKSQAMDGRVDLAIADDCSPCCRFISQQSGTIA